MVATPEPPSEDALLSRALAVTIRIALVTLVVVWCFQILRPFLIPIIWGGIISVAVYPAHQGFARRLGDRPRLSAALLTAVGLLALLIPIGLFAGSMVESAQELAGRIQGQPLQVPPPPAGLADWPIVGERLFDAWSKAQANLGDTIHQFAPQLRAVGGWLLSAGAGTGAGLGQFLISIVIAGAFLAGSEGSLSIVGRIVARLAGAQGASYVAIVGQTVRSVALGILGVAVIQAMLIGIGFVAVGVPHAGVWSLACLALAVLQLPAALVVLPVVIYVFSTKSTGVAVVFTIWSLMAGLSDNVLKPILLGRGSTAPMIVIFMGSIGGFLMSGFIGLFVGAVVLALGYELLHVWLGQQPAPAIGDERAPAAE